LQVFTNYDGNAPFCLDPAAIFRSLVHTIARCFGTYRLDFALGVVVDDSGYLRGTTNLLMRREP